MVIYVKYHIIIIKSDHIIDKLVIWLEKKNNALYF